MRLTYCEIENYGKISGGKKIDFNAGLHEFFAENGYGKTTLCSFIRAMFYGLSTRRGNDASFGDRERFYPFYGGKFGGSITFLHAGKVCRIERFFDEKSAAKDSFKYYENDVPVFADGAKIGKELFGLDEEAFCRSLFFDSREAEISATDGMKDRLGAIASGTAGKKNAAEAAELLERRRKEICGDRKNSDSEISRLDKERKKLTEELAALEENAAEADKLYEERARLKETIAAEEAEENALRQREAAIAKGAAYLHLKGQAEEFAKKRAEIEARYPAGLVSLREIEALRRAAGELTKTANGGSITDFSEEKEAAFIRLSAVFALGVPSEEKLAETEEKIALAARIEAETAFRPTPTERERSLFLRFGGKENAREDAVRAAELNERHKRAEKRLREIRTRDSRLLSLGLNANGANDANGGGAAGNGARGARGVILLLFAVLCLACGFALSVVLASAAPLIAGGVAGVAFFCGALVTGRKKGGTVENGENRVDSAYNAPYNEEEEHALQEELARISAMLTAFLSRYGYPVENTSSSVERALIDYADYEEAARRFSAAEEAYRKKAEEKRAIEEELDAFFVSYRLSRGSFSERIRGLRNGAEKFEELQREKARAEDRRANARQREETLKREVKEIFSSRRLPVAALTAEGVSRAAETFAYDYSEYAHAAAEEKAFEEKAAKYAAEQGVSAAELASLRGANRYAAAEKESAAEEQRRIEALRGEISENRKRLAAAERAIAEAESAAEEAEKKDAALAENAERTAEAYGRLKIYKAAIELLKESDGAVSQRYVAPVKERFLTYAALLEETLGVEVAMNKDFSLSFSRGGERRKDGHLSAGVRSVCAFCLRLALIDVMFAFREQPFLVLDDPFVHLDEAHFQKTARLLRKLGEERQILYFTCHASRKVSLT